MNLNNPNALLDLDGRFTPGLEVASDILPETNDDTVYLRELIINPISGHLMQLSTNQYRLPTVNQQIERTQSDDPHPISLLDGWFVYKEGIVMVLDSNNKLIIPSPGYRNNDTVQPENHPPYSWLDDDGAEETFDFIETFVNSSNRTDAILVLQSPTLHKPHYTGGLFESRVAFVGASGDASLEDSHEIEIEIGAPFNISRDIITWNFNGLETTIDGETVYLKQLQLSGRRDIPHSLHFSEIQEGVVPFNGPRLSPQIENYEKGISIEVTESVKIEMPGPRHEDNLYNRGNYEWQNLNLTETVESFILDMGGLPDDERANARLILRSKTL